MWIDPWIPEFDPLVRKIPRRRKWQPTPVFLPGKIHGQRGLEGCSPWGCKESEMTEHTHTGWLRPSDTADQIDTQYSSSYPGAAGFRDTWLCKLSPPGSNVEGVLAHQLCHRRASTTWRCPTNSQGLFLREHLVIWPLIQEAPWLLTAAGYTNNTPLKVLLCMPSVHQTHPSRGPDARTQHINAEGSAHQPKVQTSLYPSPWLLLGIPNIDGNSLTHLLVTMQWFRIMRVHSHLQGPKIPEATPTIT